LANWTDWKVCIHSFVSGIFFSGIFYKDLSRNVSVLPPTTWCRQM
jgi:hypothetical protein